MDPSFQNILNETRNIVMATRPGPACPSIDQLIDYATDQDTVDRNMIDFHLQDCLACRLVVLRIRASHFLWRSMLEQNTNRAIALIMNRNKTT